MIRRHWKRIGRGDYAYFVGGIEAGGVYRDTQDRWQWYAEPLLTSKPLRADGYSGDPLPTLREAKAAVIQALGGAA